MMFAAWLVEPDASGVEKTCVDLPYGRLSMKGEMSTLSMARPSSARICASRGQEEAEQKQKS